MRFVVSISILSPPFLWVPWVLCALIRTRIRAIRAECGEETHSASPSTNWLPLNLGYPWSSNRDMQNFIHSLDQTNFLEFSCRRLFSISLGWNPKGDWREESSRGKLAFIWCFRFFSQNCHRAVHPNEIHFSPFRKNSLILKFVTEKETKRYRLTRLTRLISSFKQKSVNSDKSVAQRKFSNSRIRDRKRI